MILRKHRHDHRFTIIDNAALQDDRLSFKATGLLAFLLSLPDDWDVDGRRLVPFKTDGRDSVYSGLKELEDAGYLVREKVRSDGGTFVTLVHVYEVPSGKSATGSGKPGAGSPGAGSPGGQVRTETEDRDKEDPPPPAGSPDGPVPEAKPNPIRDAAAEIVNDWWETMDPKPAQKWVAVVQIVERLLKAGWSPQSLRWALDQVPTPSIGTMEFALRRVRKGSVEQVRSAAETYLASRRAG